MNDEMSTRLAQELLDAADEDARARVVVRWLPDFARCQVTTAARVKAQGAKIDSLGDKVDALADKMDAYHAPKQVEDESVAVERHVPPILVWLRKNWTWLFIMILCLKNNGLVEIFQWIIGVER